MGCCVIKSTVFETNVYGDHTAYTINTTSAASGCVCSPSSRDCSATYIDNIAACCDNTSFSTVCMHSGNPNYPAGGDIPSYACGSTYGASFNANKCVLGFIYGIDLLPFCNNDHYDPAPCTPGVYCCRPNSSTNRRCIVANPPLAPLPSGEDCYLAGPGTNETSICPSPYNPNGVDPCVTGTGCCLCDRCCDGLTATQCTDKGGSVMSGSCTTSTTQTACKNANVKPPCRQGKWKLGKLPPEHWAGRVNTLQQGGRMEVVSITGLKTKDLAGGSGNQFNECRQVYGWLQRSATKNVMEGRICNTYNRSRVNCGNPALNANKSPTLNLVRSTTNGAMEFTGRFRIPCPESTDMGCATTVGCAA